MASTTVPWYLFQALTAAKSPTGPGARWLSVLWRGAFLLGPQGCNHTASNFVYLSFGNESKSLHAYSSNNFRNIATCSWWWGLGRKLNGRAALFSDWCCTKVPKCFEITVWKWELRQAGALLCSFQRNKSQAHSCYHTHCIRNSSVPGVPVASGSWNNTKNFIITHWFSFQHTISFESNGSIKSYLWGQPRYRQMLTRYWWQGGKKLLNTADQYLVSLLQPSADIKYISLQLQK